jgi:hypothetical protein
LKSVKLEDGRTPEYIFLHFGSLNVNGENFLDWYTLYRVPPACEWVYISPLRIKEVDDEPAAKALAIYPRI